MWHMCFFNSFCSWEIFLLCMYTYMCVCVFMCVCVCVSIVFSMIFRQLPYLKFHTKIFATNWSQIWMFCEDLVKYILSLKNGNITCKKWNKDYKKEIKMITFLIHFVYPTRPSYKKAWKYKSTFGQVTKQESHVMRMLMWRYDLLQLEGLNFFWRSTLLQITINSFFPSKK